MTLNMNLIAMAKIFILNRAFHAHFNLEIMMDVFFVDLLMILLPFFYIDPN